eukprot:528500_1
MDTAQKARRVRSIERKHHKWIKRQKIQGIPSNNNYDKLYFHHHINKNPKRKSRRGVQELLRIELADFWDYKLSESVYDSDVDQSRNILDPSERPYPVQDTFTNLMECINCWSYLKGVFDSDLKGTFGDDDVLEFLSECLDNDCISRSVEYHNDLLCTISINGNTLYNQSYPRMISAAQFDWIQTHKQNDYILQKIYEIESKYSYHYSSEIHSALSDCIDCGQDIVLLIVQYLPYMRTPKDLYTTYINQYDHITLNDLRCYTNMRIRNSSSRYWRGWDGMGQDIIKTDVDSGVNVMADSLSWIGGCTVVELYCYRVWQGRECYVYPGLYAIFVGKLYYSASYSILPLYFCMSLTRRTIKISYSKDWNTMYLALPSDMVRVDCYQRLQFMNELYHCS